MATRKEYWVVIWWQALKGFLSSSRVPNQWPALEQTPRERYMREHGSDLFPLSLVGERDEDILRRNAQRLEMAKLDQERDIANANLKAQHKIMIATLITALIALLSSGIAVVIALHNKPPIVNVRPNVIKNNE
jgi:hypothetical protein